MKDFCNECGEYKEVSSWVESEWEGGYEKYDAVCENCFKDITGEE